MKRVLFITTLLAVLTSETSAQVVMPAAYSSSSKINFVRTWDAMAPITHADTMLTRPYKDVRQTTVYFDGLGRLLQTVIKKGSLITGDTARDMVNPAVYNAYGKEEYKYLPFAANNTGSNNSISDGKFKLNPFQQDSAFNKGMFSDENYYYGKTVLETSPLSRPLESYAPGDNWVGSASQSSEANRHGNKVKYWINTSSDSVRVWTVTDVNNSFGNYSTSSIYAAGSLLKNVGLDEHHKQVLEFKDKEGKIILKKVQLTADADTGTGKNHTGWLCTYYAYDDLGQLRVVIQPKAVELLATSSWSMTGTILDELCFRYEYDNKGRMIMKNVPGAGIVYMIYDMKNRLVMAQDSLQRAAHKWQYTLYDALNRSTTTGLITDNTYYNDAAWHRGQAENSTNYPNTGSYTNEELTKTFYDDYSWRSGEGNPLSATRSTGYDSYLLTASNTIWPYPQDATAQSNQLNGMVTGTKTKVLGTSTYFYSVIFYDDKGRVIQTQSTNISGGTDISTVQYSWAGQPVFTIVKHEKAGTNAQTSVVLTKPTYDDLWRLIKTEKKISITKVGSGSMPTSWTTINTNEYNALGQLKKKRLGAAPLDSLEYEYNIRGWMLGMNRTYVKDTTSTSHWFGFDLGYDKTSMTVNGTSHSYAAAQYNGNIAGTLWRSTGDDMLRKYDFTYDAANRLQTADFNQLNSNSFSKTAGIDFSLTFMSYDLNGNILAMRQKGWKLGGSVMIDSLIYGYTWYDTYSNRLIYVKDMANDSASYLGDFKEKVSNDNRDYWYDGNGNLTTDINKGIDTIIYNHLNLADSIHVTGKGGIKYVYDAAGTKLKKITTEGSAITTTLYMAGNYVNDTLQFLPTEEGRARIKDDSSEVVYDYMIKDHLGNVRVVLTEEQRTDAYPAATMEEENSSTEEAYYYNLPETRVDVPSGYPSISGNLKVGRLNGEGNDANPRIGPAIILKVMAGDKFNLQVNSWFDIDRLTPATPTNPFSDLLTLIGNSAGTVTGGHPSSGEITSSTELSNSVTSFLNSQTYDSILKPKAYINWLLLDERFNYVANSSGFEQVGDDGVYTTHSFTDMPLNNSGYLYIFVSNATKNIDVFFDNLQVTHIRGPLVQDQAYSLWGLELRGINSKAMNFGGSENKLKYNGKEQQNKEFSDGSGLELYDFGARQHDPQIGRWTTIDPLAQKRHWVTPYNYVQNNPMLRVDPNGLTDYTLNKKTGEIKEVANTKTTEGSDRILKTKKDGSIKEKNGVAKVAIAGIEKGILKDGINFQKKDNLISVGGKDQPTEKGVEAFTLKLSNYLGKEIGGAYFSKDGASTTTHVSIGRYENNTINNVIGGHGEYLNYLDKSDNFLRYSLTGYFHTHPMGSSQSSRDIPSEDDIRARNIGHKSNPNLKFNIITSPIKPGDPDPYKIPYTNGD